MSAKDSSLLQQAIIDATELREAAIRNAEQGILEKYAPRIRQAVDELLEDALNEEDDEEAPEPNVGGADDEETDEPEVIPTAATTGEKACPCPADDKEIEINFEDLNKLSKEMVSEPEDMGTHMDLAGGLDGAGGEASTTDLPTEESKVESSGNKIEEDTDDVITLSLEDLEKIKEELVANMKPVKDGHLAPSESQRKYQQDIALAAAAATEAKEEIKTLKTTVEALKTKLGEAKNVLESLSLANARLLYQNKVYTSDSLNERQKASIVEAVSKARSVGQAKLVYETLSETVIGGHKAPAESITEVLKTKQGQFKAINESQKTAPASPENRRMQELAGLKKS